MRTMRKESQGPVQWLQGVLNVNGSQVNEAGYCSLVCQRARWPYHALAGIDGSSRRSLYRVARLHQILLLGIRERLWNTYINRLECDEGGNIILYEATNPDMKLILFQNQRCKNPQAKDGNANRLDMPQSLDLFALLSHNDA